MANRIRRRRRIHINTDRPGIFVAAAAHVQDSSHALPAHAPSAGALRERDSTTLFTSRAGVKTRKEFAAAKTKRRACKPQARRLNRKRQKTKAIAPLRRCMPR